MDMTNIYIPLLLVFAYAVNSKDMTCVELNGREWTWSDCLQEIHGFVGDLDTVFRGSNPMIWPPKPEAEIKDLCVIYEAVSDDEDIKRSDVSPEMEQYLSDGFHDMMEYILCEKDGIKGYVYARECLGDAEVQEQIKQCFKEYRNFNHSYNNIKASNARVREHCKILKAYQQCRIEVFRDNCDSTVAEWNNHAFTEYYGKYATEVHCNIDGGLTTEEIIYVVLGCIGGVLVLFCLCFVYSRFQNCSGSNAQLKSFFLAMSAQNKKQQEEKKKSKKEAKQKNEVAKKGKEKDIEAGKAKQNGEAKSVAEAGYYNTKELDNNSVNERKEEESGNDRRKDTTEEQDEQQGDERDQRRDYRDSPRNPRRDNPKDYPRGSPRDYPRGSPRDRYPKDYRRDHNPRLGNRSGPSYDDNFHARLMMNSRGPRRY